MKGSSFGGGVLYKILDTASWADQGLGVRAPWSMVGKEFLW